MTKNITVIYPQVSSIALILLCSIYSLIGQNSYGGQILTKDSYQYGRFEVRMQSADGAGIVSSFFLYNVEAGKTCTWPEKNNEIDIEMTGNDQQIYFTTHHPDPVQPWFYGEDYYVDLNPHESLQNYAIEWEPGIVRWFVNDQLIYSQEDNATDNLIYPMAIMMNLWASDAVPWVGVWNPSVMPRQAKYDYVKYYEYTPGQGNTGTNNNFSLEWEDNFNSLDTSRWELSDFRTFEPFTTFRETNIEVGNGQLTLTLDEPQPSTELIPVTFSVNMDNRNLLPSEKVYLNGSFNNWCGTCNPMTQNGDVWSLTINLKPEKYEYLFTINGWTESGNAPMGSSCDYQPCDDFANYGVHVRAGASPILLDTYYWKECETFVINTSISPNQIGKEKKLLKTYDLFGRELAPKAGQLFFYLYDDGSIEKKVKLGGN